MTKLYLPDKIVDSKFENNKLFYYIKWKGYKELTWEPERNISHRTDLIEEFKNMDSICNLSLQAQAYIYCRVSTKEQSKYSNGHTSLEVQEEECRKYCESIGVKVISVVKEIYSAKNMDMMKGLNYLIDIATRGQHIYVYDISRFSRNTHHALNILEILKNKGVSLVSVSEKITYSDPNSRNQFRLQLCSANHVSEICSEKVKASVRFRRARGDYIGRAPFGFKTEVDEKTNIRILVQDPEEMKIISCIDKLYKTKSVSLIKDILIKKDYTFRNRTPTVISVLRIVNKLKNKEIKIGK